METETRGPELGGLRDRADRVLSAGSWMICLDLSEASSGALGVVWVARLCEPMQVLRLCATVASALDFALMALPPQLPPQIVLEKFLGRGSVFWVESHATMHERCQLLAVDLVRDEALEALQVPIIHIRRMRAKLTCQDNTRAEQKQQEVRTCTHSRL